MIAALALAPTFTKGVLTVVCAFILFIGSVYLLIAAVFGRKMGLAVLATALFSWMIILSLLWTFGIPGSAPKFEGPRGTEAHWQVVSAGTGATKTDFPATSTYPEGWRNPTNCPPPAGTTEPPGKCNNTQSSVQSVIPAIQAYLAAQAQQQLSTPGQSVIVAPTTFAVTNVQFATSNGSYMAVGRGLGHHPGHLGPHRVAAGTRPEPEGPGPNERRIRLPGIAARSAELAHQPERVRVRPVPWRRVARVVQRVQRQGRVDP